MTNNKKNKKKINFVLGEVIILIVITSFLCFFISFVIFMTIGNKNNTKQIAQKAICELEDVEEAYNYILNNYYGDINKEKLLEGAINGMIDSLGDKNAAYIDENTANNFNAYLNGNYEGIGVQIALDTEGNITIVSIFNNTPAMTAGLKIGDKIKKINNIDLANKTTMEAVEIIKKSKNKRLELQIMRNDKLIDIDVVRGNVVLDSVSSKIINQNNKKAGYIYISIFALNTYEQFSEQLKALKLQGIDSLIIDVRDNSGGHLASAEKILSLFIESDKVLYQIQDKNGITKHFSKTTPSYNYPIVVLTNGNSASASEILASALKEQYNAKIVGEKTFGKGTVQELKTTQNGFEYKFTTQYWLTSNGGWINDKGIEVDYNIELDSKYYETYDQKDDNQLQKAMEILK